MFNRRHIPLAVAATCVLVLAASAAAAPNTFTAALTPAFVKPATAATYTLTLVNGPTSAEAGRAKVGIPAGFTDVSSVTANATAAGSCQASAWEADGTLIADGKINLKRPSGGGNRNLCPDATLTVTFSAVSAGSPGTYPWTPELYGSSDTDEPFTFSGNPAVTVDGTAPDTAITSAPPAITNSTSGSFSFGSSETGSTYQCRLDGAAFAACTSPQAYPGPLAGGSHTFAVRAIDPAGNVDGSPASHTWTIDTTAPNTTIISSPPLVTNQTSAGFTFTSTEANSTFQCSLDNAGFADCPSGPYTGLGAGIHNFRVRATDPAGNADATPASYTWTIDIIAPNTTITSNPLSVTNQTTASFGFSSTEAGSTFECSLDGAAFAACTNPKSYTGLPGGTRRFEVRAKDPAGNTDASPAIYQWTIDLVGVAAVIGIAPPSVTSLTSASFTFSSSEPDATFECSLDAALFTGCSSPLTYNNLTDGPHTFKVRAIDHPAGNTGPEASHTWSVDTRPPTATVTSGPAALGNSRSATFTFSADEPSSFQCSLDGGGFVPCSSPTSYADLGDGAHTFVARPTDAVGNPGASGSYAWTVDGTAPDTTLLAAPRSTTTSIAASFRFSASESAGFQCKLDAGAFGPCSSPKSYARLRRSRHTFQVRAIDPAGNVDPTPAVRRWTIAAATPRTARTASALLAPRAGSRVTSPPLLAWRRVSRASFYNVQLYRGRVKVLSAWPTRTRLQLRARWRYLGREHRLSAGTYRWYVWPGFGRASAQRYGRLLGQSTFTVTGRR
ncbi:MAG TPA: hypothetical protein VFL61_07055 [Gaiellaceae bacterium]|nr:hypothetical protein [Gaiellaceae bacterium]